ncbi:tetratricopeptide repeat protein [Streptomyces sp. NPDC057193]|uniref:tetratricopeptide repeat protein n=1 Tax=Streptomyces sp. NPDC057193 TaxID=3346043 RepID=UPI00363DE285
MHCLLAARELGPSIPEVHSLLGYAYLQKDDKRNAEISYRTAYECDERDFDAVYDYAYILAETGRAQEALTVVLDRGLADLDEEQQARLLTLAAEQHAGLGDLPSARDALERVLLLTPDDPDARANLDHVLEACR